MDGPNCNARSRSGKLAIRQVAEDQRITSRLREPFLIGKNMDVVIQEEATGCGIAASAALASWERLPDKALLAIKWRMESGKPFWHWVLFIGEGGQDKVLDSKKSLRSNVRRDFGRMKPKWYIEITN